MADELRFIEAAPGRIPLRVARTRFTAAGGTELTVTVSDRPGVAAYSFAFGGAPVPISHDTGTFKAIPGSKALLEWVMIGSPGGTMKVDVTREDGTVVATRERSLIVPPYGEGYDALEIRL